MRYIQVLGLFLLLVVSGCAANTSTDILGCKDPCVITDNLGGRVQTFQHEAQRIRSAHEQVVINGLCASSCAIFADEARPYVCITPRALFVFHKEDVRSAHFVSARVTHAYRDPPFSSDIAGWVRRHGGFPRAEYVSQALKMRFREAKRFWPVCEKRTR